MESNQFDNIMIDLFINICNIVQDEVSKDTKYIEAQNNYNSIYKEIECLLPKDKKNLIYDIDEAATFYQEIYEKALFFKGLEYGVKLKKLLNINNEL